MKRKQPPASGRSNTAKKPRGEKKNYCDTPQRRDDKGNVVWPAPDDEIIEARRIIQECADVQATTVICPDKDADGLTSGVILHRTLVHLGLPPSKIKVHLLPKNETVHSDSQRAALAGTLSDSESQQDGDGTPKTRYLFVLDHGTATSPPLAPPTTTKTLIIDHHFSSPTSFPEDSAHINASHCPPVATTSLLTHLLCAPLFPALTDPANAWLAAVGTHGDLGTSLAWTHPFPDLTPTLKAHTRKAINDTVSLLNAPRRTATYDVSSAWTALVEAATPAALLASAGAGRLRAARAEVNAEVSRWQAAAPSFAADGSVAVVRIASQCQIHPVIATRWAGTLRSTKLRIVMCANSGYVRGRVNFSCRIARCAVERAREERPEARHRDGGDEDGGGGGADEDDAGGVDIIAELKAWAAQHPSGDLLERMGSEFARGHVQASGGIVGEREFEDLMGVLRVGEKRAKAAGDAASSSPDKRKSPGKGKVIDAGQKTTLMGYFGKK